MLRLTLLCACTIVATASAGETPREVFERRVLPIFRSPNPSSCAQCHLTGVDLKDYLKPDADETFRSLRDQNLVDLDKPEQSKILKLIAMGADKPSPIHDKVRATEREAFAAWLAACAADPTMRAAAKLPAEKLATPKRPDAVIRHGRTDRLLEAFERDVWAWRFRCMNCHTEGTPQNDKLVAKHGPRVAWVKKAGAAATMDYLLTSKLIELDAPDQSLLLRKPLGEDHGGGVKFSPGDQGYQGFRRWIEDVAALKRDRYRTPADLPPAGEPIERFGTDVWFKLTDCPPEWAGKLLQVRLFAWNATAKAWEPTPIATSDRMVAPKGDLWQHNLTLLAAKGSERAKALKAKPALPTGRYLVRVYVDATAKLSRDWTATLGEAEYAGQADFTPRWREGYGGMTAVKATELRQ
ncbi:MAG: hypothetical protein U0746_22375 [Gemmataceae bacterium]